MTRFIVDSHTRYRLRQWLCGKHKTAGAGTGEYPDEYLYENLGLIRLEKLTASRIMFLSFDSIGAVPELGIFDGDGYVSIGNRGADAVTNLILQRFRQSAQVHVGSAPPK